MALDWCTDSEVRIILPHARLHPPRSRGAARISGGPRRSAPQPAQALFRLAAGLAVFQALIRARWRTTAMSEADGKPQPHLMTIKMDEIESTRTAQRRAPGLSVPCCRNEC